MTNQSLYCTTVYAVESTSLIDLQSTVDVVPDMNVGDPRTILWECHHPSWIMAPNKPLPLVFQDLHILGPL